MTVCSDTPLCECGCGLPVIRYKQPKGDKVWSRWADKSHSTRKPGVWNRNEDVEPPKCECGCGLPAQRVKRQVGTTVKFSRWHNRGHSQKMPYSAETIQRRTAALDAYRRKRANGGVEGFIPLPKVRKALFEMRDRERISNAELAERCGVSLGEMSSILYAKSERYKTISEEKITAMMRRFLGLPELPSRRQRSDRDKIQDARRAIEHTYGIRD